MKSITIAAFLMVLLGTLFILAAIVVSRRTKTVVPETLKNKWLAMTTLMFFFLAGYVSFLLTMVKDVFLPLELLTGSVFLGGSFFVFLVINLTQGTITKIRDSERNVNEVNERLLQKNLELERENAARGRAERRAQSGIQRLAALHSIDMMISASLDLQVTLNVFLDQALPQLRVDAADVLILDPRTQILEYKAGRGFRKTGIRKTSLRLGQGSAGRVALEQRMIQIDDLAADHEIFERRALIEDEAFKFHVSLPLMAKGQVKGVLEIFHRSALDPEPEWFDFLEALTVQAALAIDNATLFKQLQISNAELTLAYDTTIEGWARALELRDRETEGHTERVTGLTLRLARSFGMNEDELVHVRRGALLHDIGKMGISDSILLKDGPLTDEEKAIMRRHPVYAFEMLSPIVYLRPALDIPYCHHERWDGAGYPRALKGEQIPLAARIFSVADTWDALRSKRRYHEAWPKEKVIDHIRSGSGSHFDPRVVDKFLEMCKGKKAGD